MYITFLKQDRPFYSRDQSYFTSLQAIKFQKGKFLLIPEPDVVYSFVVNTSILLGSSPVIPKAAITQDPGPVTPTARFMLTMRQA
jgi:hypothetical protein